MDYISLNKYLRDTFGEKVYKIALDGGFTCPNRDGNKNSLIAPLWSGDKKRVLNTLNAAIRNA